MQLKVIGSNSSGNGYILKSDTDTLILELGCRWSDYQEALDYDYSDIVGCLVTHKHNDHIKSIKDAIRCGFNIYSCTDVADKFDGVAVLEERQPYKIGSFIVTAYKAYHDVECYGFLIQHKEMGRLLFFTDTSQVPYKFRDIQHILIEANSDEEYMVTNAMDNIWSRSSHNNHLSLNKAINFVVTNKSVTLQNVILIHLSEGNADPKMFRERFIEEVGIEPIVAKKGLTTNLEKEEF